jgi:methylated-DNA-[protein]-cysteine S-methyltransferase
MDEMLYTTVESPVGELLLVGDGSALHGLVIQEAPRPVAVPPHWRRREAPFAAARGQLQEYFAGARTRFDLPLADSGTPFQREVWRALQDIPYGETISYGELARRLGRPAAIRAVGRANGANPIAIVVPCHRVIGADGSLTGYAAGTARKRRLLDLEAGVLSLG